MNLVRRFLTFLKRTKTKQHKIDHTFYFSVYWRSFLSLLSWSPLGKKIEFQLTIPKNIPFQVMHSLMNKRKCDFFFCSEFIQLLITWTKETIVSLTTQTYLSLPSATGSPHYLLVLPTHSHLTIRSGVQKAKVRDWHSCPTLWLWTIPSIQAVGWQTPTKKLLQTNGKPI